MNDDGEAIVDIVVRAGGSNARLPAVIDTGFSEFLTLPSALLLALGATVEREERLMPGDGSIVLMDAYVVEIEWSGGWRNVKTYASESDALIGMKLLSDHDLHIRVVPGGAVSVVPV